MRLNGIYSVSSYLGEKKKTGFLHFVSEKISETTTRTGIAWRIFLHPKDSLGKATANSQVQRD